MPKVSVIIPTYNSEEFLRECLDSVVNQTLQDIEIIVVDSISQDNTIPIVEEYISKDPRVKLIKRDKEYVGISRNAGIDSTLSKYIMFLDSDDVLEQNACEIAYDRIKNDNVDFAMFGHYEITKNNKKKQNPMIRNIVKTKGCGIFNYIDLAEFIGIDSVEPWKKIYNLELLNKHNIRFGNESFGEDAPFYWKILVNFKKCSICNEYLYNYRKIKNKVGTGAISTRYITNFEVFETALLILQNSDRHDLYIKYFLIALINNYSYWLQQIRENQREKYYYKMQEEFKKINKKYHVTELLKSDLKILNFFIYCLKERYIQFPFCKNKIFHIAKYANILKFNILGIKVQLRRKKYG